MTQHLNSKLHRLGVTSAFVKCETWRDLFSIGSRVEFQLPFEGANCDRVFYDDCDGIIVGHHRDKFMIWSLGDTKHQLIRIYADRLTVTDDMPVAICSDCHKPRNIERDGWLCDTCGIPYLSVPVEAML